MLAPAPACPDTNLRQLARNQTSKSFYSFFQKYNLLLLLLGARSDASTAGKIRVKAVALPSTTRAPLARMRGMGW